MSTSLLIVIAGMTVVSFGILAFLMLSGSQNKQLSRLKQDNERARSYQGSDNKGKGTKSIDEAVLELESEKEASTSDLTLPKRLKYAQLELSTTVYHIFEFAISLVAFALAYRYLNIGMQIMALFAGPVICGAILNRIVMRRFSAFDRDYPPFLLSLVGLLKTGMNPMQAMDAAAQGLEEGSLLRSEVESMLERLRVGIPEERSIGDFGHDIYHPEIELFVQALLLSRKVGGTLSDTLERLAKQVRRRQQFRAAAQSAVGMQRGSIYFILGILVALVGYISATMPDLTKTLGTPIGKHVLQGAIIMVMIGMYWIKQVTKIKA